MTDEDESFIRTIVDNPDDDLPRLIYADWLDEQDDPRGGYLRAECDAVTHGLAIELRSLSESLDPVWVARVSRPPFGVCWEPLRRNSSEVVATPAELERVADTLDVVIPAELQALLLNYELGELLRTTLGVELDRFGSDSIDAIVCIIPTETDDDLFQEGIIERTTAIRNESRLIESGIVFLAGTVGDAEFIVACEEYERGTVYLISNYGDPDLGLQEVANSIGEFLAMLTPRPIPE